MLTDEMRNECVKKIDYCIKHTKQKDLAHTPKILGFQLNKHNKPIRVYETMQELADALGVSLIAARGAYQGARNELYVKGYSINKLMN